MRIDLNPAAQPLPESGRTTNQSPASAEAGSSASHALVGDQAQLSGVVQVQALAAQISQLPEVRQEKVTALRQAVLSGSYQPSSQQVADALFAHMLVQPAA